MVVKSLCAKKYRIKTWNWFTVQISTSTWTLWEFNADSSINIHWASSVLFLPHLFLWVKSVFPPPQGGHPSTAASSAFSPSLSVDSQGSGTPVIMCRSPTGKSSICHTGTQSSVTNVFFVISDEHLLPFLCISFFWRLQMEKTRRHRGQTWSFALTKWATPLQL